MKAFSEASDIYADRDEYVWQQFTRSQALPKFANQVGERFT